MTDRRLLKLGNGLYSFTVDGIAVVTGPLSLVKMHMQKHGIPDVDLAAHFMKEYDHDVATFGIIGKFLFSSIFEDTLYGNEIYPQEVQ